MKGKALGHYIANVRDIEFNLFEVLGRQDVLGTGPYAEIDADHWLSFGERARLGLDDEAGEIPPSGVLDDRDRG